MPTRALVAAVLIGIFALPTAQAATPTRIRGTVDKLDGHTLIVKSREGPLVTVTLAPDVKVSALDKKSLADIKDGDYVASTGVRGPDGQLHAVEVRIFPQALRGVGEGQYPWDLSPGSMMTNATVTGIGTASAPHGKVLKVVYKGVTSEYIVGPKCPIYGYVAADTSLLKPGAAVFIIALKKPDGSLTAARITAEKDGIKPPM